MTQRRIIGPFGLLGGEAGSCGKNLLAQLTIEPGEKLEIHTPGGGGWGVNL